MSARDPRSHLRRSRIARPRPELRPYRIPYEHVNPIDRPVPRSDLRWLEPAYRGPAVPPEPPWRPPTAFGRPPAEDPYSACREPLPFHPRWVLTALVLWSAVWLALYVASALWLRV